MRTNKQTIEFFVRIGRKKKKTVDHSVAFQPPSAEKRRVSLIGSKLKCC